MSEISLCPSCGEKIGSGLIRNNFMLADIQLAYINLILQTTFEGMCSLCSKPKIDEAIQKARLEIPNLLRKYEAWVKSVPVVSIPNPPEWDFSALRIVTAQTVIGTGVIAEIGSDVTDFFGGQSSIYQSKLQKGEDTCLKTLQSKCVEAGGNAIVGVDVDYGQAGASKGMLMVCMTGTAVALNNSETLFPKTSFSIAECQRTRRDISNYQQALSMFSPEHNW